MSGIIMANGVVLRDGIDEIKVDEDIFKKSLFYVAKISRGLFSGDMNADPDFNKFQDKAMKDIIDEVAKKISGELLINANKQLVKVAERISSKDNCIDANTDYTMKRRGAVVKEIEIEAGDDGDSDPIEMAKIIDGRVKELESMSGKDLKNVVAINDKVKTKRNNQSAMGKIVLDSVKGKKNKKSKKGN